MLMIARPLKWSCDIEDLRLLLMSFNFEKLLYASAITEKVTSILRAIQRLGLSSSGFFLTHKRKHLKGK